MSRIANGTNILLMMKDSVAADPNGTPASIVVVEHWFEELKRLVPTK